MGSLFGSEKPTPEQIIEDKSIESKSDYERAAYFINKASNVVFLTGAGISTNSGIPDFRSPKTGIYDNLEKYNLPFREAIFTLQFFNYKPQAFYEFAKPFVNKKFYPTDCHYFQRILEDKKKLKMIFTQNIDGLEVEAGIPHTIVLQAHGGLNGAHCTGGHKVSIEKVKEGIINGVVLLCDICQKPCKPDLVFFGENLPSGFSSAPKIVSEADLVIVMGTSLKVSPFNGLVDCIRCGCPVIIVNMDPLKAIKINSPRKIFLQGDCDKIINKLAQQMNWEKELKTYSDEREKEMSTKKQ